jgi:hypothetical protein
MVTDGTIKQSDLKTKVPQEVLEVYFDNQASKHQQKTNE